MRYNLEGKISASISNAENGEVNDETLFHYHQEGDIVWAEYEGGPIKRGHLIANVVDDGKLDMRYHHINSEGKLMIGKCVSIPEKLEDGRLKFREEWQWLSGDESTGTSEIIEIDSVRWSIE